MLNSAQPEEILILRRITTVDCSLFVILYRNIHLGNLKSDDFDIT